MRKVLTESLDRVRKARDEGIAWVAYQDQVVRWYTDFLRTGEGPDWLFPEWNPPQDETRGEA
jgi:hypothetical protein